MMLLGQMICGNGICLTVTVNVQLFEPHEFVATHVTGVTPIGKQNVGGGEQPTRKPLNTIGNGYGTGWQFGEQVSTMMLLGQLIIGEWPWLPTTCSGNSHWA